MYRTPCRHGQRAHFFDFDDNFTPHFRGSQRACFLKSIDNSLASCQLWATYNTSSEQLQCFRSVCTLLYIDEEVIDIKPEWFSAMKNLRVLHVACLSTESEKQVDVMDLKFLEELINMKQLRLLSLESFPAIQKLPNSICKLTNLRVLNLRYCSNLEELPVGIGSLKSLTHLDLTQCHLLSMLPKGLKLLSKLEVLKGFVINHQVSGRQHQNACTYRELLNLEKLRILSLVVNNDAFPDSKDVGVLKEMKILCNLGITWKRNCYKDQEPLGEVEHEALRPSRWQKLKCWEQHTLQDETEEEPLRRFCSGNLQKLVLCCFPSETTPNWLSPFELQDLKKLCIYGGNLDTLPTATNQYTWNFRTLKLDYLHKLDIDNEDIWDMLPNMTVLLQRRGVL